MKYSVKCNNCNEVFMAETDKYGQQKYRCPYCGNVVTCQFNEPEVFRTKARSIIPIIDADEVAPTERQIPVATTVLSNSSSAQATGDERDADPVSYTHLTLPTKLEWCRSRWSPYH